MTSLPVPTEKIGPGAWCLNGYVWRSAFPHDYVCVRPWVRAQAAADNAAALSRIAPGGGAYGPYTCKQGYVWRQIVPDDYVCVLPAVRAQAAADNTQFYNRAALLRIWISNWTPPHRQQQNCHAGVCATINSSPLPEIQINGDHFNFGPVVLQIRRNNGVLLWTRTITAASYPGHAGGSLTARSSLPDCSSGQPQAVNNAYAIAFDKTSQRWSRKIPLDTNCGSL